MSGKTLRRSPESKRSGERLLEAARRVSGSESIYRINKISSTGEDGLWIVDGGLAA